MSTAAIAGQGDSIGPKNNEGKKEDKLINVRLRECVKTIRLEPERRSYQDELYKLALAENVIIFLGTGLGKTFITVLYINAPQVDEEIQKGRKVVFLAPTQDLIKQQAEYINKQVPYRVKIFCGRTAHCGEHIDHWNESTWAKELSKVDLLFMTPMIFSNAVATNILDWRQFAAVIFDEFHHACVKKKSQTTGSPYYNILRHHQLYYANKHDRAEYPRPRLIGLTASLINAMPKNRDSIRGEVLNLEKLIMGRCVTNLEVLESKPTMIMHSYSSYDYGDALTPILINFQKKLEEVLKNKPKSKLDKEDQAKIQTYHARLLLAARGLSIKPASFPKIITGLIMIRQRCGLFCLEDICTRLCGALDKPSAKSCMAADTREIYSAFTETLRELGAGLKRLLQPLHGDELLLSYTCAKPLCLLDILKMEYENTLSHCSQKDTFSCIIFVRSRLEVTALCRWVQQVSAILPEYKFIKCDYAIGLAATMASKYSCITKRKPSEQAKMLENFRNGALNVIVTTSVLEEGIDLPVCSTVIRYDPSRNFREYVQSRGRARQKISTFVTMCELNQRVDEEKILNKLNDFEITLKEIQSSHDVRTEVVRREFNPDEHRNMDSSLYEQDVYTSKDNAIRISGGSAKVIVAMYCQQLSRHTPLTGGVRYEQVEHQPGHYQTSIYMPAGCPIEGAIKGNVKSSSANSLNSAIVAVLRALIEAKELSPNGVPFRVNEENLEEVLRQHELKPVYTALANNDEFGILEKQGEREYFRHKLRLRSIDDYMSRNCRKKTYKFVPIRFVGADENVRTETKALMEVPVFGLIFESTYDTSFIPEFIYTHYGKYEVLFRSTSESLSIGDSNHHNAYLSYTHKLLTKCLGISRLPADEFRCHCQCYVVPLSKDGQLSKEQMESSFTNRNYKLREGDVVKLRRLYTGDNNFANKSPSKLMIVRRIRDDMTARSFVPNKRDRVTFAEEAERQYGRGVVRNLEQSRVIEVAPLSSEFGRTDAGKRRSAEYRTNSCFYLEHFLEYFEEHAAAVIQAFNLPEIIHRLYTHVATAELDRKFMRQTKEDRVVGPISEARVGEKELMMVEGQAPVEGREELDEANERGPVDVELDDRSQDGDDGSDSGSEREESDQEMELDESESDEGQEMDQDDSDVEIMQGYKDMIAAKRLDLMDDDDDYHMEKWNFERYQVDDLAELNFTRRSTAPLEIDYDKNAEWSRVLDDMKQRLDPLMANLINKLESYELKVLSDAGALDDESELSSDLVMVNKDIKPPFLFANADKPLESNRAPSSRTLGLMESISLRGARQGFNLEALENVGDSYLKYLSSVVVYQNLEGSEGILTSVRSKLTCNKHFTYLARRMKLGTYAIDKPFSKERLAYVLGQDLRPEEESELMNRLRSKDLADMFESIVGSYLVYQGEFEAVLALKWLGLGIFKADTFTELSPKVVRFAPAPSALDGQADEGVYRACKGRMSRVEKILGYKFKDPAYLVQAFTHASYLKKCTRSYERLEFLGDAILDYLITVTLFQSGRVSDPGQMTASRSALVNNNAFARLSLTYKFDIFLLHFNHEIYDELVRVRLALEDDPEMSYFDLVEFDAIVKLLGDLFESVAGAIYLDSGCSLDAVWAVFYPMLKRNIDQELSHPSKNLTALLYETFPGKGRISFEVYDVKSDQGHMVGVRCNVQDFGSFDGRGLSKRQAKQRAVQAATAKLPSEKLKEELDKKYRASLPPREGGRLGSRGRGRSARGSRSRGRGHFRR